MEKMTVIPTVETREILSPPLKPGYDALFVFWCPHCHKAHLLEHPISHDPWPVDCDGKLVNLVRGKPLHVRPELLDGYPEELPEALFKALEHPPCGSKL